MSIFRTKLQIINYLSTRTVPKKLDDIITYLEGEDNETHTKRKIKEYLFEMSREGIEFDNKKGRYGGYMLAEVTKNDMVAQAVKTLDEVDRNAINDAFELALCSASYHYSQELRAAKTKLYARHNLKDEDFEYYVGKKNDQRNTDKVYALKKAIKNKNKVFLKTKYKYEDNDAIEEVVSPLFLIHDSDETFLVIKDHNSDIKYQNIKNIEELRMTNEKVIRMKKSALENTYQAHLNKAETSIKTRKECVVELEVLHVDGWAFYDLWHHECEEMERTDNTIKLKFFEMYRAAQFLIIIMEYCRPIHIGRELSDYMEQKILTNRAKR